jgi:hypothetical protein
MSDETRERIKKDAQEWADPLMRSAFYAGLEHQHPIAYREGWNEAVEEIIKMKKQRLVKAEESRLEYGTYTDGWMEMNGLVIDLTGLIKELESLKKPRIE